MLGEKFGHFCLNRLRQQGTRSVAQHLGERVSKRPWLKQLDDGSIGHGVSLLCWRSGGANTPTIRRLLPFSPSPTSANTSPHRQRNRDARRLDHSQYPRDSEENRRQGEPWRRRGDHQARPRRAYSRLVTTFYTYPEPTP